MCLSRVNTSMCLVVFFPKCLFCVVVSVMFFCLAYLSVNVTSDCLYHVAVCVGLVSSLFVEFGCFSCLMAELIVSKLIDPHDQPPCGVLLSIKDTAYYPLCNSPCS